MVIKRVDSGHLARVPSLALARTHARPWDKSLDFCASVASSIKMGLMIIYTSRGCYVKSYK